MLHGILIVDKPAYVTSAGVVEKVRRKTGTAKAGHTGTLDPLATGVLPICLGAACKLAGYLLAEDKGYEAELELGRRTTTLDRTGEVLEERFALADAVTDEQLEAALARWRGAHEQLPPMYSAIKQDGVRLYERARAGKEVERTPRAIVIHRLEVRWRQGRRVGLSVACSKGTFVRSLVDDIGAALGCGANLTQLRRTQSGHYTLAQAIALDDITVETAAARMIPVAEMLPIPSRVVPRPRHQELRDGRPEVLRDVWRELVLESERAGRPAPDGMMQLVSEAGRLLALIECRSIGASADAGAGAEVEASADAGAGAGAEASAEAGAGLGLEPAAGWEPAAGTGSGAPRAGGREPAASLAAAAAAAPGTSTIPSAFTTSSGPGARYLRVFPEGFVEGEPTS